MLTAKVLYDSVVSQFAPQDVEVMHLPPGVTVKYVAMDSNTDAGMILYAVDHRNRTAFPIGASQDYLFHAPRLQFESVMGTHYQRPGKRLTVPFVTPPSQSLDEIAPATTSHASSSSTKSTRAHAPTNEDYRGGHHSRHSSAPTRSDDDNDLLAQYISSGDSTRGGGGDDRSHASPPLPPPPRSRIHAMHHDLNADPHSDDERRRHDRRRRERNDDSYHDDHPAGRRLTQAERSKLAQREFDEVGF